MKALEQLTTHETVTEAKAELEAVERDILNARGDISDMRGKLNKKQDEYRKSLADDSVPIEDLEALKKEIEAIEKQIGDTSKRLKELQQEKPQKEEAFDTAKDKFLDEVAPLVSEAFSEMAGKFDDFKEAHQKVEQLRSEILDMPLSHQQFPRIKEPLVKKNFPHIAAKHIQRIDRRIPIQIEQWEKAV